MGREQLTLWEKPTMEIFQEFYIKPRNEEFSFVESLRKLKEYSPLPSEKERKERAIIYVVRQWFSQKIREKYNELVPELFELKQEIALNEKQIEKHIGFSYNREKLGKAKIPVFARAELDKDKGWVHVQEHRTENNSYQIYLSSEMPRIPLEIRKAGRDALALAYKTYGDALVTEVLSDIITENPSYAPKPEDAKLIVLWKPKPEEIHLEVKAVDRDPALIMQYNRLYLVSTWREPDEEPFMIYLQGLI
jgi:hypothetical protein